MAVRTIRSFSKNCRGTIVSCNGVQPPALYGLTRDGSNSLVISTRLQVEFLSIRNCRKIFSKISLRTFAHHKCSRERLVSRPDFSPLPQWSFAASSLICFAGTSRQCGLTTRMLGRSSNPIIEISSGTRTICRWFDKDREATDNYVTGYIIRVKRHGSIFEEVESALPAR